MSTKVLIILTLFSASLAFAHPNHLSFEKDHHNVIELNIISPADKLFHHDARREKQEHSSDVPCTDKQHKEVPCEEK